MQHLSHIKIQNQGQTLLLGVAIILTVGTVAAVGGYALSKVQRAQVELSFDKESSQQELIAASELVRGHLAGCISNYVFTPVTERTAYDISNCGDFGISSFLNVSVDSIECLFQGMGDNQQQAENGVCFKDPASSNLPLIFKVTLRHIGPAPSFAQTVIASEVMVAGQGIGSMATVLTKVPGDIFTLVGKAQPLGPFAVFFDPDIDNPVLRTIPGVGDDAKQVKVPFLATNGNVNMDQAPLMTTGGVFSEVPVPSIAAVATEALNKIETDSALTRFRVPESFQYTSTTTLNTYTYQAVQAGLAANSTDTSSGSKTKETSDPLKTTDKSATTETKSTTNNGPSVSQTFTSTTTHRTARVCLMIQSNGITIRYLASDYSLFYCSSGTAVFDSLFIPKSAYDPSSSGAVIEIPVGADIDIINMTSAPPNLGKLTVATIGSPAGVLDETTGTLHYPQPEKVNAYTGFQNMALITPHHDFQWNMMTRSSDDPSKMLSHYLGNPTPDPDQKLLKFEDAVIIAKNIGSEEILSLVLPANKIPGTISFAGTTMSESINTKTVYSDGTLKGFNVHNEYRNMSGLLPGISLESQDADTFSVVAVLLNTTLSSVDSNSVAEIYVQDLLAELEGEGNDSTTNPPN